MREFSVISKGKYTHKQTNEFLHVDRFLIIRKKKRRMLLLDLDNRSEEKLTALELQIDQFDARGNALGSTRAQIDGLQVEKGKYVLKKEIEVHRACMDFRVKVLTAEYGAYAYRLGENDTYITYEQESPKREVNRKKLRRSLGNKNFVAKPRQYKIPLFVSGFVAVLLLFVGLFCATQALHFDTYGMTQFHRMGVTYEFTDENYNDTTPLRVIGAVGGGANVVKVPAEVDGHPVQSITDSAFQGNSYLEEITIADGVRIETGAFSNCKRLTKVTLLGSHEIPDGAFYGCTLLKSVSMENVSSIGQDAFSGCHALTSLKITSTSKDVDGTLTIGKNAFYDCRGFSEIFIKRNIQYGADVNYFPSAYRVDSLYLQNYNYAKFEGEDADLNKPLGALFGGREVEIGEIRIGYTASIPANFTENCGATLRSVKIDNIEKSTVGDNAFADCEFLHTVSLPKAITSVGASAFENTALTSFDGSALKTLGAHAFMNCTQLAEFKNTEKSPLKSIPADAFKNCVSLRSILVSKSVSSIGTGAFSGCTNVETLTFAKDASLTGIMPEAFAWCRKIRTITLPEKLEWLRDDAFADCRSLRKVTLPASLTSLSDKAFTNCYKLYEITNNSEKAVHVGYGVAKYAFRVYTPSNSTPLEKHVQNGFVLAEKGGEWYAIDYEGKGGNVALPQGVNGESYTLIDHLFGENTTVTGITLSSMVGALGSELFLDSAVESVTVGQSYRPLDSCADTFAEASSLKKVDFENRSFSILHEGMFANCENLEKVTLNYDAHVLPAGIFWGCSSLKEIENTYNTEVVGDSAFSGCGLLEAFEVSFGLSSVGRRAFYGCAKLENFTGSQWLRSVGAEAFAGCKSLSMVGLPSSLTELGASAFEDCSSLTSIDIVSITEIKDNTFAGCTKLANINYNSSIQAIGAKAFYNCRSLKDISLSEVVSVGEKAFSGATSLIAVYGSETVREIGDRAFYGCTSLTDVHAMFALERLGAEAFRNCTSLQYFSFGYALTELGEKAFLDCKSLLDADLGYSKITLLSDGTFKNCLSLGSVKLPETLELIDVNVFENCPVLHEVYSASPHLDLERDNTNHGHVAYNALVINPIWSLQTETHGDFTFKRSGNTYFLVGYSGAAEDISLGEMQFDGVNISVQEIARYAFKGGNIKRLTLQGGSLLNIRTYAFTEMEKLEELRLHTTQLPAIAENTFTGCQNLKRFVIGKDAAAIAYGAFVDLYPCTIYYMGTWEEWTYNSYKYGFEYTGIYYYDACVHYGEQWNFDADGNINTEQKAVYERIEIEPTCRANGLKVYYCPDCDYRVEETIYSQGHSWENGKCTVCGYIHYMQVTKQTYETAKTLADFNAAADAYDQFETSDIAIVPKAAASATVTMTIKAKTAIRLEFACWNATGTGTFVIQSSDGGIMKVSAGRWENCHYILQAGESLTIAFTAGATQGTYETANICISDIFISHLNEP